MKEQVLELLKDSQKKTPIDWGDALVDEDEVFETISSYVFSIHDKLNTQTKEVVLLAAVINLNMEVTALKHQRDKLLETIIRLKPKQ